MKRKEDHSTPMGRPNWFPLKPQKQEKILGLEKNSTDETIEQFRRILKEYKKL